MPDVLVSLSLVLAAGAYFLGTQRAWAQAGHGRLIGPRQPLWFASGLLVCAAALESPLHTLADHDLSAHMVQHVLLLAVAPPLLVAGSPLPAMLWSLPHRWRDRALRRWRRAVQHQRGRGRIYWLVTATVVHILVLWAWHLPVLYDAAVAHDAVHAAEHLSFLLTACGFWWAVGLGPVAVRGQAIMAVFATSMAGTALGVAMLLAARPWYGAYPSLGDQEIGAVIMWAFPGIGYAIAAAALFITWVGHSDRRAASTVPRPPSTIPRAPSTSTRRSGVALDPRRVSTIDGRTP